MQGTERLKSMCCRPSRTVLVRLHCARRRADPVTPVSRLAPKPVDSLRTERTAAALQPQARGERRVGEVSKGDNQLLVTFRCS